MTSTSYLLPRQRQILYTTENQHQRNRLCVSLSTLSLIIILLLSYINDSVYKTTAYYLFHIYLYYLYHIIHIIYLIFIYIIYIIYIYIQGIQKRKSKKHFWRFFDLCLHQSILLFTTNLNIFLLYITEIFIIITIMPYRNF